MTLWDRLHRLICWANGHRFGIVFGIVGGRQIICNRCGYRESVS